MSADSVGTVIKRRVHRPLYCNVINDCLHWQQTSLQDTWGTRYTIADYETSCLWILIFRLINLASTLTTDCYAWNKFGKKDRNKRIPSGIQEVFPSSLVMKVGAVKYKSETEKVCITISFSFRMMETYWEKSSEVYLGSWLHEQVFNASSVSDVAWTLWTTCSELNVIRQQDFLHDFASATALMSRNSRTTDSFSMAHAFFGNPV